MTYYRGMPAYKRQHFLPCAYLKNFSPDGARATRDSRVWRIDETRAVFVPVKSQCIGNYLFSKDSPEKTELEFQNLEKGHDAALAKIWSGNDPTNFEYFALIASAFDLYARNIAHENHTGGDGFHAYGLRTNSLLNRLVVGNYSEVALPLPELLARIKEHWRVSLFLTPQGRQIITSDHPVLCYSWGESEGIDFLLMPVTPTVCAAVFDRRSTRAIGSELTETDGTNLFHALAAHAQSCLYSAIAPDDAFVAAFRFLWKQRVSPATQTDPEKWSLNLIVPRDRNVFSFIRPLA